VFVFDGHLLDPAAMISSRRIGYDIDELIAEARSPISVWTPL
jgi:hypothetical protein